MSFVDADKLSFHANGKILLNQASFSLPPAGLICLIGVNGSGKTTLLRLLANLLAPTTGSIKVGGQTLGSIPLPQRSKTITWAPQQSVVPFSYQCQDLLLLGRFNHHQGYPTIDDTRKVLQIMKDCGIASLAAKQFHRLSSGEQRKVLLARAIVSETPIILLDEPLSNLDPRATKEALTLLRTYSTTKLIIMSTHHIEQVRRYGDEVLVLDQGSLIASGKTADVLTDLLLEKIFGVNA